MNALVSLKSEWLNSNKQPFPLGSCIHEPTIGTAKGLRRAQAASPFLTFEF